MIELLDKKISQMHAALGGLENDDISSIEPEIEKRSNFHYCKIDFSQGQDKISLANIAGLLISNIACMKDHLKVFCKKNGIQFDVEQFVNTDKNVAIVHDLWNIDKHAELDRKPRSGITPRIIDLRQVLNLATGTEAGDFVSYSADPKTGKMVVKSKGGGRASLQISGTVVDENDNSVGNFSDICESAVAAWERALVSVGVTLPVR